MLNPTKFGGDHDRGMPEDGLDGLRVRADEPQVAGDAVSQVVEPDQWMIDPQRHASSDDIGRPRAIRATTRNVISKRSGR
jgi:hypothetical protein